MEEHKRPWPSHLVVVPPDHESDQLSGKERKALEADVRYWRNSSKRKDEEIAYRDNQIRGFKGHINRLHAQLYKKGVYKV